MNPGSKPGSPNGLLAPVFLCRKKFVGNRPNAISWG